MKAIGALLNALVRRLKFGACIGCRQLRCPLVGSRWRGTLRREFAYCPACMPDLYRERAARV